MKKQLVLASQSPRRQELLAQLGYQFAIMVSDIDESVNVDESAKDYVLRLACEKAQYAFNALDKSEKNNTLVLGSDTSVVINGNILGKPKNETNCIEMLSLLSNNKHQVLTSIAVASAQSIQYELIITNVLFKPLTTDEMKNYWLSKEPQDKAGSYAIQGIGGQFVKSIQGSYSAVVGLPLYETAQLLAKCGLPTSIQANYFSN
ncbi:MAG: Maf family nucleotide pyrophosphatase [Colwellia sp.]